MFYIFITLFFIHYSQSKTILKQITCQSIIEGLEFGNHPYFLNTNTVTRLLNTLNFKLLLTIRFKCQYFDICKLIRKILGIRNNYD
jgi:hypothetical protein